MLSSLVCDCSCDVGAVKEIFFVETLIIGSDDDPRIYFIPAVASILPCPKCEAFAPVV